MTGITQMYLFPMDRYSVPDIYPRDTKKWNAFLRFHQDHPEVYDFFRSAATKAKSIGHAKIGARLLMERVRWNCYIERKGEKYKINNNHFPLYARLFIQDNPDYKDFFEFRKLKERNHG